MNDKLAYFIEMDPNMVSGIALYRVTFEPLGAIYDVSDEEGEFHPLDEVEWADVNHTRLVEVTESIVDKWKERNPLGYDTIAEFVV